MSWLISLLLFCVLVHQSLQLMHLQSRFNYLSNAYERSVNSFAESNKLVERVQLNCKSKIAENTRLKQQVWILQRKKSVTNTKEYRHQLSQLMKARMVYASKMKSMNKTDSQKMVQYSYEMGKLQRDRTGLGNNVSLSSGCSRPDKI